MFKKAVTFSVLAVSVLVIVGTLKLCFVTSRDISKYTGLVEQYKKMTSQSLSDSATQSREGVRKDIWFSQEDKSRLHYRIESESSLLTMAPNNGKFEMVENLSNIRCWMQEKLYGADQGQMQQIRFLKAAEGIYRFNEQEFLANSVDISLFRMPGHELATPTSSKAAFLNGNAEDISFSVSGKTPQFQAHHFTASLRKEDSLQ